MMIWQFCISRPKVTKGKSHLGAIYFSNLLLFWDVCCISELLRYFGGFSFSVRLPSRKGLGQIRLCPSTHVLCSGFSSAIGFGPSWPLGKGWQKLKRRKCGNVSAADCTGERLASAGLVLWDFSERGRIKNLLFWLLYLKHWQEYCSLWFTHAFIPEST